VLAGKNPLLIALALGLVASALATAAIRTQQRKLRAGWDTVKVLCADQDIPEGTELDRQMVAVKDMPERFVSESYIRVDAENKAEHGENYFGQRLLVPLKKGDPVLVSHFEALREAEFSTMINQKGRAVTIDVQERNAVGLWVRPNDHVDVVGTFTDAETHQMKTTTLLQNVVVLATGHSSASSVVLPEEEKRYQTVTLLVLPEEAEILTLAQDTGTLTLLLRNPDDLDYQEKRIVIDAKSLLAGDRAGELQQKRYRTIQIIRGAKSTTNELAGTAGRGR
jgi:pilus assembly protein CpaB